MPDFTEYEETGLYEQDEQRVVQAKREPHIYLVNLVKDNGKWRHEIVGIKSINK